MLSEKSIGSWALMLAVCFVMAGYCSAQSDQSTTTEQRRQRFRPPIPPQNYWRKDTVSLTTQTDTLTPDIRKLRDAYWNVRFPPQTGPYGVAFPGGSSFATTQNSKPSQEFPEPNNYQWIIGRFEAFHVYQTSGRGGLYTEINIRVQHIFKNQPQTALAEGQLIDIAISGGTAIDSLGKKIDFFTGDTYPLHQPEHTYLMQIIPCQMVLKSNCGNFYFPGKKWDLSDGTVQPVDPPDVYFAATGKSSIAGTPASTIVPLFERILASFQNGPE